MAKDGIYEYLGYAEFLRGKSGQLPPEQTILLFVLRSEKLGRSGWLKPLTDWPHVLELFRTWMEQVLE